MRETSARVAAAESEAAAVDPPTAVTAMAFAAAAAATGAAAVAPAVATETDVAPAEMLHRKVRDALLDYVFAGKLPSLDQGVFHLAGIVKLLTRC